ncbi:MAG: SET domain-containing protein [Gammaproteobacteria bacterium]|nr:SET domain-containing protein [Gammaproteobacteria bacterium]
MMANSTEFTFILQPSPLGGVGVFAAHDIPNGMQLFSGIFKPRKMKISDIPDTFRKYVIYLNDAECLCPERFDRMEIGWYLNHSPHPNIIKKDHGLVYAVHDIKKGEEILIDYNHLNEPECMKEDYYK